MLMFTLLPFGGVNPGGVDVEVEAEVEAEVEVEVEVRVVRV